MAWSVAKGDLDLTNGDLDRLLTGDLDLDLFSSFFGDETGLPLLFVSLLFLFAVVGLCGAKKLNKYNYVHHSDYMGYKFYHFLFQLS